MGKRSTSMSLLLVLAIGLPVSGCTHDIMLEEDELRGGRPDVDGGIAVDDAGRWVTDDARRWVPDDAGPWVSDDAGRWVSDGAGPWGPNDGGPWGLLDDGWSWEDGSWTLCSCDDAGTCNCDAGR